MGVGKGCCLHGSIFDKLMCTDIDNTALDCACMFVLAVHVDKYQAKMRPVQCPLPILLTIMRVQYPYS